MLSLTALALISATILVPENYPTIGEAVVNASPGDSIIVGEGIYHENVVITKPLVIRSKGGPDNTIVGARVPSEPVFVLDGVDNVEITGFTATGSLLSGIYLKNSHKGIIDSNKTTKNGNGIILHSSSENRLMNNQADENDRYGIYLESSHRNTVAGNSANTNRDNGIFLSYSNDNTLADNNANLNAWNGILLWDSSNNAIRENRTWRNRFGIVIGEGGGNTLIDNSEWSNLYIILPPVLVYLGIISYMIQKRILRTVYRV